MKKISLFFLFALNFFTVNATNWVITFAAFGVNGQVGNPACSTADISFNGSFRVVNALDNTQNHPDGPLIEWYKNSGGCSGTIQFTGHPYFMIGSLPSSTTTYYAKLPDGQCLSYTLVIYNTVAAPGTITGSTSVCKGQTSVTYSVPSTTNVTSYTWTKPSGVTGSSTTNSITLNYGTSAASGNITVKGYNTCGYGPVSTLAVTVNPLPLNTASITGTLTVCQGQSVTYSVPTITYATSYVWTLPSGATGTSSTNSITVSYNTPAVSGNITIKGNNACGYGPMATFAVTVNPLPAIPTITQNGTTLTSSSATGYQWYKNGIILSGATFQNYTVTQNGNYTVMITDANGCSMTSAPFNFATVSIEDLTVNNSINVIPNPSNGSFRIETNKLPFLKIKIYNIMGEIIYESENRNTEINISNQPKGTYFIAVHTQDKIYNKKLIIQ